MVFKEQEKTITIQREFLAPDVTVQGQAPYRNAIITFFFREVGSDEIKSYTVQIGPADFNEFYTNWDSDAFLFKYMPDVEFPDDIEPDITNEISPDNQ